MSRIERRAGFFRREIIFNVRFVIGYEVGPAKIPGSYGKVELIATSRAPLWVSLRRIWPDIAPKQPASLLIDAEAERISAAHDVNLRPSFRGAWREEVACRNGISAVRFGVDP